MIDWLKQQTGNSASRYAMALGVAFVSIFGFLLANQQFEFVRFDQKLARSIFTAAAFAFAGSAFSINRLRIARHEEYSFAARSAGILASVLAVFCFLFFGHA